MNWGKKNKSIQIKTAFLKGKRDLESKIKGRTKTKTVNIQLKTGERSCFQSTGRLRPHHLIKTSRRVRRYRQRSGSDGPDPAPAAGPASLPPAAVTLPSLQPTGAHRHRAGQTVSGEHGGRSHLLSTVKHFMKRLLY